MDDRRHTLWVVVAATGVALIVVFLLRSKDGESVNGRGGEVESVGSPSVRGPSGQRERVIRAPGNGADARPSSPAGDSVASRGTAAAAIDSANPEGTEAPAAVEWVRQASAEFTEADLERAGEGVQVDLGEYRVRVGDPFEVQVRLTGPPMESITMLLGYDPGKLSVISDSARPVGPYFRRGIEFYVDEAGGRIVLIHSGKPGMKNINGASGAPVAAFRMRALAEGDCELSVVNGTSFTSGRGGDEKYSVYGGAVHIR